MGAAQAVLSWLMAGRRLGAALFSLFLLSTVAASGATWQFLNLGPFSVRVPAGMLLERGGTDSLAGTLTGENLRIDYDFGLYADPLQPREGLGDFQVLSETLDGLPARFVRYTTASGTNPAQRCSGVHVPEARRSAMGRIRFTMLACGDTADDMQRAQAIFSTLRFRGEAVR